MPPRLPLLHTLALCTALALPASAQTPTTPAQPVPAQPSPEGAASLEKQITTFINSITAGAIKLPPRPVQFTPEGDHYLLRVPLAATGVTPADAAFTAKARMLDSTRWELDDQQFPSDVSFATTQQVPDAPDAKNPSPDGTHAETVTYHLTLGKQDASGTLDPANKQPTSSTGTVAFFDIDKTGGDMPSHTRAENVTSRTSTRPTDPNHIDSVTESSAENYQTRSDLPFGGAIELKAHTTHLASTLSGVALNRVVPMVRAAFALGRMAKAQGGDDTEPTPAERAELHSLLELAKASFTGGKLEQSFEGITYSFAGQTGSLAKAAIAFGGDAPQATLSAQLTLLLDGLVVDALPPEIAPYVPTHFAITPTMSNLNLAALTAMGLEATAPEKKGAPPAHAHATDTKALFGQGGINLGFDMLELDVAGAHLTGAGKFNVPNENKITGQADLSATGLDALIIKLQADPAMAQGVPVAIFLKGIARTTGDKSVWQVTVNNTKVLVNGVDLSAMAGMMK